MPPCFVPDYLLEANNWWTVVDMVMTLGTFLISDIMLAVEAYIYDMLVRIRRRNTGISIFFMKYPKASLAVFQGYDPNHKNDIMQEALEPLDSIQEDGLAEPFLTRAEVSATFYDLNKSMVEQKNAEVDFITFLSFVREKGGQVSADQENLDQLYAYASEGSVA